MPALNLDPETVRLAETVAALTGETPADAVRSALYGRLRQRHSGAGPLPRVADRLNEIARRCAALPDLDLRSANEILGYDDLGLCR